MNFEVGSNWGPRFANIGPLRAITRILAPRPHFFRNCGAFFPETGYLNPSQIQAHFSVPRVLFP